MEGLLLLVAVGYFLWRSQQPATAVVPPPGSVTIIPPNGAAQGYVSSGGPGGGPGAGSGGGGPGAGDSGGGFTVAGYRLTASGYVPILVPLDRPYHPPAKE